MAPLTPEYETGTTYWDLGIVGRRLYGMERPYSSSLRTVSQLLWVSSCLAHVPINAEGAAPPKKKYAFGDTLGGAVADQKSHNQELPTYSTSMLWFIY